MPEPASPFALVIFDHDGVLVDSEIIAMDIISGLLTEHGVPTTVDEAIITYLGGGLDVVMDVIEGAGTPLDREAFDTRFHQELFAGFRERLEPIPGVRELLDALVAAGIPFVIASSGSSARVDLGVQTTALAAYFPHHVRTTREHVERAKPFPDLFLLAAERAGVTPEQCLVIEDSPQGVEAARRAGMRVVGLAHRTPADRLADPDFVVGDTSAILPLILGA